MVKCCHFFIHFCAFINLQVSFQIAEELLKRESLTYDEICELIGPPPFGHKSLVDIIEFGAEANATTSDTQSTRAPPPPANNNSKEESSN